jgi:hypothetical protein
MHNKPPFCPNCGEDTSESATFCSNCGHRLIAAATHAKPLDLRPHHKREQHHEHHAPKAHHAEKPPPEERQEPAESSYIKFRFAKVFTIWAASASVATFLLILLGGTDNMGGIIAAAIAIGLMVAFVGAVIQKHFYDRKHPRPRTDAEDDSNLNGIGGWLALFTVGLVVAPLLTGATLFSDFSVYSQAADSGYQGAISFEIIANITLIALALWSLYLVLKRKKLGVRVVTLYLLVVIVVGIADTAIVSAIQAQQSASTAQNSSSTPASGALWGLIWIVYFLKSKRVKATLVQ